MTTIRRDDIASADPILLRLRDDAKVLDAEIVSQQNQASCVSVKVSKSDRSAVSIDFDFLDYNQPTLIRVVHTGNSDSPISLQGQIIGAGLFSEIPYKAFVSLTTTRRNIITTFCARSAASFQKTKWSSYIGVGLSVFAFFECVMCYLRVTNYFLTNPLRDALSLTAWEAAIYIPVIYATAATGYFTLFRMPPEFYDEFEQDIALFPLQKRTS